MNDYAIGTLNQGVNICAIDISQRAVQSKPARPIQSADVASGCLGTWTSGSVIFNVMIPTWYKV